MTIPKAITDPAMIPPILVGDSFELLCADGSLDAEEFGVGPAVAVVAVLDTIEDGVPDELDVCTVEE